MRNYQLSEISDLPMWSRVDLGIDKPIQFFNVGGGPNARTSITTEHKIDNNKDFDVRCVEVSVQRTDKKPFTQADFANVAVLQRDYWMQLFTNDTKRAWFCHMGSIMTYPAEIFNGGLSSYVPTDIVKGRMLINVPQGLVIKGGEAFTLQLNSEVPADDLSGLTMLVTLFGSLYRVSEVG